MRRWLVSLCSLAWIVPGCGATASGPGAALAETAAALRGAPDAPELATGRAHEERLALADALEHARLERRATVTIASAEGMRTVVLVEEDGELHVEAGVLGVPALDTPERALAALHRALAREIDTGTGGLLAEDARRAWLEERSRYRDGTAHPDALDVRVDGDTATALTPLGDEILLQREGAEWRVASMRAAGLE